MTEYNELPAVTKPRAIVVTNEEFVYGNIEAWINIIESYRRRHPEHRVSILYEGEPVNNLVSLFKLQRTPGDDSFKLVVTAPDKNLKDVPKLYRLLVEGAGPNYQRFIQKE
ncbi:MAG: hypothetical protein HY342_00475, partial [Candidatus Lambdaproteobacteria bacterium]|nr:hypothetical protein [Candidatus Lambdaproteobacteria bacterium]